jgi:CelD/BcsL family acetyltransferase involved in cellulose biosynthesis
MLRTSVSTDPADLERLAPRWRALLARAAQVQPVMTPLWQCTWWSVFGDAERRTPWIVTVEDGNALVGLLLLTWRVAAHRAGIPVRRLELLGKGEKEADEICSDYVGAVVARGMEHQVARALAATLRHAAPNHWDELRMPSMSAEDPLVPELVAALGRNGILTSIETSGECPYIPLPGTWDAYLQALGSARRYAVTRSLRELDKWAGPGGWELRRARTAGELSEGVRVLSELHAERWTSAGKSGVFSSERFRRFHEIVMPRLLAGEDGASLDLSWLVVRGEPIAASYNVVHGGRLQFYQSGRRVDVPKNVRPGIAMHALAIRASIEAGLREYDFLAGASRYKRDLALEARNLVTLRAIAPGLRARVVEAARVLTERAIARMRSTSH